jgi:hypothetical protein
MKGKKKRKNFATGLDHAAIESLMTGAGTLAITMAVNKCTFQEKMLISAMIPSLIKLIRTVSKSEREEILITLWPPEPDNSRAMSSEPRSDLSSPN